MLLDCDIPTIIRSIIVALFIVSVYFRRKKKNDAYDNANTPYVAPKMIPNITEYIFPLSAQI